MQQGFPFPKKPYRDGEDFDPYIFDGSMSIEDYKLMHRMIEKRKEQAKWTNGKTGYSSYDRDRLDAADKMKIERGIYFDTKGADISPLTALPTCRACEAAGGKRGCGTDCFLKI